MMRSFIGAHEALDGNDFIELALGTPLALWLGVEGESEEERAARVDAARDILAEDPELFDRVSRLAVLAVEEHAPALLHVLTPPRRPRRPRKAVAA
ncbi:hypothetical protein RM780_09525 [Streptomyces sp. DSM 44917]|uniref:Uncharacterized protein n=1 Tax=Streptomyces boetiae TaxID=3075541 RepID=A0ABU2L6L8_9ACTN|nr:hypothetical protein [Streptomyces sp. DSM 44917]MDT0307201.1 hypothetical protein [Streptomyces sp. DSM 44917]